jgi:hypothetical protein
MKFAPPTSLNELRNTKFFISSRTKKNMRKYLHHHCRCWLACSETHSSKTVFIFNNKKVFISRNVYDMCVLGREEQTQEQKREGSKKISLWYLCERYILQTYNSIMNDKFMCLCFPEFSGKYVCDIIWVFIQLFFAALGSLLSVALAKKEEETSIETFSPLSFYCHRLTDGFSSQTKATCIDYQNRLRQTFHSLSTFNG